MFDLYSPDDSFDANFLKNYGALYLIDDIKRVSGVGEVNSFGSDYSMRNSLKSPVGVLESRLKPEAPACANAGL